jgi:DNA-binding HxlR family transcriptional regulator
MRSYAEYCAIAKSLDVVGDRWTLLIVRELALRGACRYTDLRNGLPGIATNLLADRLRDLEDAGVVGREDAPPPIATTLFRLTHRGEELRPVMEALTRWGLPLMTEQKPDDAVRSHWLASALEQMLTDARPEAPWVAVVLQTGDHPIMLEARDGAIHTRLARADRIDRADGADRTDRADRADLILTGAARPIMGLLLGLLDLDAAAAAGVTYEGDPTVLGRFGAETAMA